MKRYQFTLEGVLRLRIQQSEAAEAVLSGLHEELSRIHARQQQFNAEVRQGEAELLTPQRVLDGEILLRMDEYRRWAAVERRRQAEEVTRCISKIQEQNARVLEAKRNQQLLEKLRDRSRQRWETEAAREEQALAEEAFFSQWGKQQPS
jgi:flagellar export protein FliJ